MKPTRTENNKPSQSSPIRKGKMSKEEIEATAKELTKGYCNPGPTELEVKSPKGETKFKSLTTTGSDTKTYRQLKLKDNTEIYNSNKKGDGKFNGFKVVEAPAIEPVVKGDYKAFATSIKGKLKTQETVELTGDFMKSLFPQAKCAGKVVQNLKNSYGLSYRRVEKGRNDTYVFFVEPTKEELIVQLTSAESKVIELEKEKESLNKISNPIYRRLIEENKKLKDAIKELSLDYQERYDRWGDDLEKLGEENSQLKSELSNQHIDKIILLGVAILSVISIILK